MEIAEAGETGFMRDLDGETAMPTTYKFGRIEWTTRNRELDGGLANVSTSMYQGFGCSTVHQAVANDQLVSLLSPASTHISDGVFATPI